MIDQPLEYKMGKKRPTTKTVKHWKFIAIDPFNEKGFELFARGVIDILFEETSVINFPQRKTHQYVKLQKQHFGILKLFTELIENEDNLTEKGKYYSKNHRGKLQMILQNVIHG